MRTASVYDRLGAEYLAPERHSTTAIFRKVQHEPLSRLIDTAGRAIYWWSEMNYLIVGGGPEGDLDQLVHRHRCVGSYLDAFDPRHATYLDRSAIVLEHCRASVTERVNELFDRHRDPPGTFVLGSAERLEDVVPESSQHMVLAALCDHFQQDLFFESAMRVLKPGGALITSYPADGINRVVRERIYQIPPTHTRFMINGIEHVVPSQLMTEVGLGRFYRSYGFERVSTENVTLGSEPASDTLARAAAIMGRPIDDLPIVVVGIGYKPKT